MPPDVGIVKDVSDKLECEFCCACVLKEEDVEMEVNIATTQLLSILL